MLLAYIDESGNTGSKLDDPLQPIHYVAAILVPEDQVASLTDAVDDLVAPALGPGRTKATELHGSDLFGGNGPWRGVAPSDRVEIYRAALRLVGEHSVGWAHASIQKPGLAQRYHDMPGITKVAPHLLALQFLVEKIDGHLGGLADPLHQRALLVADETQEHEAFALDLLTRMQRTGGPVGRGRQTGRIVDTVHFVRSETNRGVQLADLVVYVLNRIERSRAVDSDSSRAVSELWGQVEPLRCTWRQPWP